MNRYTQKSIISKVEKTIKENGLILPNEKIVVALSGGPDSMALINILLRLRSKLKIEVLACHYNHRLRGEESELDQQFVQKFCDKEGIALSVGAFAKKNKLKSEGDARSARYSFFEEILVEGGEDKIALAHNLNDFVETTIHRIVRGSGLRGLSSIPISRGKFIRPLLFVSRKEIESFLEENKIDFCTDQTNFDMRFTRNRIRMETIPYLEKLNPNILNSLFVMSQTIQTDYSYLEAHTEEILAKICEKKSGNSIVIDRLRWLELDKALRVMTLRLALNDLLQGLPDISYKQIEEVVKMILKGEGRKKKILPCSLQAELQAGKIVLSKIV